MNQGISLTISEAEKKMQNSNTYLLTKYTYNPGLEKLFLKSNYYYSLLIEKSNSLQLSLLKI